LVERQLSRAIATSAFLLIRALCRAAPQLRDGLLSPITGIAFFFPGHRSRPSRHRDSLNILGQAEYGAESWRAGFRNRAVIGRRHRPSPSGMSRGSAIRFSIDVAWIDTERRSIKSTDSSACPAPQKYGRFRVNWLPTRSRELVLSFRKTRRSEYQFPDPNRGEIGEPRTGGRAPWTFRLLRERIAF